MSLRSALFYLVLGRPPPELRCRSVVECTDGRWLRCKFERYHDGRQCQFSLPPGMRLTGRYQFDEEGDIEDEEELSDWLRSL